MKKKLQAFLPSFDGKLSCFLYVVVAFLLIGCEASFNPVHDNDIYYSIYGYLNASADTQFVRIEELRDGHFTDANTELDIEVNLTNVSTGRTEMMHDSLFYYLGETRRAHNYYTTLNIEPTHTYRLDIIKDGETISSASGIEIPDTFPSPTEVDSFNLGRVMEISGIDRLISAKVLYHTTSRCYPDLLNPPPCNPKDRQTDFEYLPDTLHLSGKVRTTINLADDLADIASEYPTWEPELGRSFSLNKIDFMVAAGTENWPDYLSLDQEEVALPNEISNVEGGVGLVGGIVTDTVSLISDPDTELNW